MSAHLRVHEADAYTLAQAFGDTEDSPNGALGSLDMIWLDFGIGVGGRLDEFLGAWWPRLRPGGLLIVHSTVTNAVTRQWLEKMRGRVASRGSATSTAGVDAMGCDFVEMSFFEPHKQFQNSCSVFQKRTPGYEEPVRTSYP